MRRPHGLDLPEQRKGGRGSFPESDGKHPAEKSDTALVAARVRARPQCAQSSALCGSLASPRLGQGRAPTSSRWRAETPRRSGRECRRPRCPGGSCRSCSGAQRHLSWGPLSAGQGLGCSPRNDPRARCRPLPPRAHLWRWRRPPWPGAACSAGPGQPCPSSWSWRSWLCGTHQTQSGAGRVKDCSGRQAAPEALA